jgi:hypothetical protein
MRSFHCSHCKHLVFFENVACVNCGHVLAVLPETVDMAALRPVGPPPVDGNHPVFDEEALWEVVRETGEVTAERPQRYRLCAHRARHAACNFAVADGDGNLCVSCRQTRILPDLSVPDNLRRWRLAEDAKRRLYHELARMGLTDLPGEPGARFEFLADLPGQPLVMTGHTNGVITVNVAEADEGERAQRRVALGEPYRTMLGHLRHESGHYYWDVLVLRGGMVDAFRAVFGDERQDYGDALQTYYANGPRADWSDEFVSAYATAHPWEDWAETWAHYLHMLDLLETAASYGTEVTTPGLHGALRTKAIDPFGHPAPDFNTMLQRWVPLTLLLNSLTRSLGHPDAYPFAVSNLAMAKLRFVHDLIRAAPHHAGDWPSTSTSTATGSATTLHIP